MIDLHTHILRGIDDGARTLDDSLDMADAAVEDGVRILAATPHVRDDFPTSAALMERRVAELRRALADEGIPLDVRPGAEIALPRLEDMSDDQRVRLGLAGNPSCVLLEFPYFGWSFALNVWVLKLATQGVIPVIAHPERNSEVRNDPERLRPLVHAGALGQVTAASLDGRLGRKARDAGLDLIDRGLAHLIASDAHTPDVRGIGMSAAAEAVGDEALAYWLTSEVPAAIVAGEPVPVRPPRARRPSFLRDLLRPAGRF
jgi:protein-tyrosine phosphatase